MCHQAVTLPQPLCFSFPSRSSLSLSPWPLSFTFTFSLSHGVPRSHLSLPFPFSFLPRELSFDISCDPTLPPYFSSLLFLDPLPSPPDSCQCHLPWVQRMDKYESKSNGFSITSQEALKVGWRGEGEGILVQRTGCLATAVESGRAWSHYPPPAHWLLPSLSLIKE